VSSSDPAKSSKAERQADVALVIRYHEARLADLLERVRDGLDRYDAGELDAFELDELIHRYKRAARELWKFCGDRTHGRSSHFIARTLEDMQKREETIDWWDPETPTIPAGAEPARGGHRGGFIDRWQRHIAVAPVQACRFGKSGEPTTTRVGPIEAMQSTTQCRPSASLRQREANAASRP
jgi:hypothetical protein